MKFRNDTFDFLNAQPFNDLVWYFLFFMIIEFCLFSDEASCTIFHKITTYQTIIQDLFSFMIYSNVGKEI